MNSKSSENDNLIKADDIDIQLLHSKTFKTVKDDNQVVDPDSKIMISSKNA